MGEPPEEHDAGGQADALRVGPGVFVPRSLLRMSYSQSSGPGGQNVNKRATRAELRVTVADLPIPPGARARLRRLAGARLTGEGELVLHSDEHRSQGRNRDECESRLVELVKRALVPPKPRKKTRPTRGSVERRIQAKKEKGQKKERRKRPEP